MRELILTLVAGLALSAIAAEGVRNPFWPAGYQGELSPISAEPRQRVKPRPAKVDSEKELTGKKAAAEAKLKAAAEAKAKAAAEAAAAKLAAELAAKAAREAELRRAIVHDDWVKARRTLKLGNPVSFKDGNHGVARSAIAINGNIYADGDLISITHDNIRFTWRVGGLDGRESLKLVRVRARRLDPEAEKKAGGR